MSFEADVVSMKWMADYLQPYMLTTQDKDDLAIFSTREICVRGYDVSFCFTKQRYDAFDLHNLQMYSKHQAFLPFGLVCECAERFLGSGDLGLCEMLILGRKLYVWSVAVARDGSTIPIPLHPEVRACSYEGLAFSKSLSVKCV